MQLRTTTSTSSAPSWATWLGQVGPAAWIALAVLTAAAAWVRSSYLGVSMRYDEAYTVSVFATQGFATAVADYSLPNNHVFHTLLVSVAAELGGPEPWVVRLPAFAAGVLQVPAVFLVFSRLSGRTAGLLAAALTAGSSALIDYSANARGYTITGLLFVAAVGLAAELRRSRSRACLAALGLVGALGLWTVPVFVYALGAVGLWLLLPDGTRDVPARLARAAGALTGAVVGAVVLYFPVLANDPASLLSNRFVEPQPFAQLIRDVPELLGDVAAMWSRNVPLPVLGMAVVGLVWAFVSRRVRETRSLALSTVVAVVLLTLAQRVIPFPRSLLLLLPVWIGVAASGVVALLPPKPWFRDRAAVPAVIALGTAGWLIADVLSGPSPITGRGFRHAEEIALELRDRVDTSDHVVAVRPATVQLDYYLSLHGVPAEIASPPDDSSGRLFVVTALGQELPEVLAAADLRATGPARLLATFPSGDLWEVPADPAAS